MQSSTLWEDIKSVCRCVVTPKPPKPEQTPVWFRSNKAPGQLEIVVASMRINMIEVLNSDVTTRVLYNHICYCELHGYDYFNIDYSLDESREPAWSKD
eukprot:UN25678